MCFPSTARPYYIGHLAVSAGRFAVKGWGANLEGSLELRGAEVSEYIIGGGELAILAIGNREVGGKALGSGGVCCDNVLQAVSVKTQREVNGGTYGGKG